MFIKGFGVGTVPLAAITKYPSAMEIHGLQLWYYFSSTVQLASSHAQFSGSKRTGVLRATRFLYSYSTIP